MTASGSLIAARSEYGSGHEGTSGFASGLLRVHHFLEHSTGILQNGLGQTGLGTHRVDRIEDAHPRTFSMVGHTPR